jgi:hypothetical protein
VKGAGVDRRAAGVVAVSPVLALEVAGILLWLPNHAELVGRFGSAEHGAAMCFWSPLGHRPRGDRRAQRNRIGWLFLAFGLAAALLTFAFPYHLARWRLVPACPKPPRCMSPWAGSGDSRSSASTSSLRSTALVRGSSLRSAVRQMNAAPEAAE